jgi:hypothetical protein
MTVTAIRKDGDPRDPATDALREAIAARTTGQVKADRQLDAIRRAKDLVATAERRVSEAAEALEGTKGQHVEELAAAVQAGSTPKSNATLRAARASLSDRTDEFEAAKAALDRLEADGDDLDVVNPQLENRVLVAVSQVIAPVAEQILIQIRRKQADLLILQQAFDVLTSDETIGVPVFNSDVQRLNAKDARMRPVAILRDQFFNLDSNAGQERAKEVAALFRRWRATLRNDPDASAPELPA